MDINEKNLKLLDHSIRAIRVEGIPVKYSQNNQVYTPIYNRGDIVQCEFTGLGKEMNYSHFAIVWSAKADNENINVIPLTSKRKDASKGIFSLGIIPNFYVKQGNELIAKESFVYLNKMMEVSRKRVNAKYAQNANGIFLKNTKDRNISVNIGEGGINRIKEAMKLFYLEEGECLVDILNRIDINYLFDIKHNELDVLAMGYRLVTSHALYSFDNEYFLIFHIDNKRYSLRLFKYEESKHLQEEHKSLYTTLKYKPNIRSNRKSFYDYLFSLNDSKISEIKRILLDLQK